MKTFKTAYRTQPATRRSLFAVSSTATGCAVLLMAAASSAKAADQAASAAAASTGPIEEVVVTGIRAAIESAISAKKSDSSIIEAISAEDIGKLPDASIAEAIGRLPGIAAQRTNGRAQTLSIRGLGPDFTVTTLNGREQASVNDNRTVEFDQYPAELVSQVKIYKTPDAGMSYQGIAGTADIETVRPLAYGHTATAFRYQRDQNQMKAQVPGQDTGGNRASAVYINQFMDNTVGVALGFAFNKTPYQVQTREPWGYAGIANNQEVIGGDKDGVKSAYFERTGIMGVLEFKPNDSLHMVFDGYHSNFTELQAIRRMEYGTIWAGATLSTTGSTVGNRVTSGQFTNVPFLVVENYNNDRRAKVDAFGWNTDYKFADNWSLNSDLSYSKVKRTDLRLESTAGLGRNDATDPSFLPPPETVSFTTTGEGLTNLTTTQNYSNYNTTFLTDPGNWGGGPTRSGYLGNPTVTDELKAIRLAAKRTISDSLFSDLTFGVNYAERTKTKYQWQSTLYLQGGVSHVMVPTAYQAGITNTSFFGNPYGMINYDAYGLYRSGFWTTIDSRLDPNANYGDRLADYTNTWEVREKLTTPYFKLDIDTHAGSVPVTGNIGVQAQRADQQSDIFFALPQTGNTNTVTGAVSTVGATYTDVLPSLNISFALPHDVKLRAAAAVTVARPRMDDMAGGANYSVVSDSASPYTGPNGEPIYWKFGGGGNPRLRPWKANTLDLSLEKYFSNRGYVSAAIYYKSLTSYIYGRLSFVDFTGVPLPQAAPGVTYVNADANREGFDVETVNGHGGNIHGVELTASFPLDTFSAALQGFGVTASAAFNQSAVTPNGVKITLPGLSKEVINSTLYYERYGFSARVSERYRGGFVGEVPDYTSALTLNNVKSEHIVDAQVGYEFKEGALKGLSMNFSGSNLTNAPFVLYQLGAPGFDVIKYEKYGAEYAFSVSYKL